MHQVFTIVHIFLMRVEKKNLHCIVLSFSASISTRNNLLKFHFQLLKTRTLCFWNIYIKAQIDFLTLSLSRGSNVAQNQNGTYWASACFTSLCVKNIMWDRALWSVLHSSVSQIIVNEDIICEMFANFF